MLRDTGQEERIEELRETHRLESHSQSEQIDRLRKQLEEAEALISANQASTTTMEEQASSHKSEIITLHAELEKTKAALKDEEEKRTKAMSLLKTVRQKSLKTEKERDEAMKEVKDLKEKEKAEREKEKEERTKLSQEVEKARAEKEAALASAKSQAEKEMTMVREKAEKDIAALRSHFELEAITAKVEFHLCEASSRAHSPSRSPPTNKLLQPKTLESRPSSLLYKSYLRRKTAYSTSSNFAKLNLNRHNLTLKFFKARPPSYNTNSAKPTTDSPSSPKSSLKRVATRSLENSGAHPLLQKTLLVYFPLRKRNTSRRYLILEGSWVWWRRRGTKLKQIGVGSWRRRRGRWRG